MGATAKKFSGEIPDEVASEFLQAVATVSRATAAKGWLTQAHYQSCSKCMTGPPACPVGQALFEAAYGLAVLREHLRKPPRRAR